jgi:hypothetical protein
MLRGLQINDVFKKKLLRLGKVTELYSELVDNTRELIRELARWPPSATFIGFDDT